MEPLVNQLKSLPQKVSTLPGALKAVVLAGVAGIVIAIVALSMTASGGESFQYAFTNLSAEDSSEAAAALKVAGIPFRLEASGAALAVPASKVYDARLLLAAAGLPRGGGVGFELFDRGDLGLSEFTQKVNLRRATEGELARTIGRLAAVRSARVHLVMGEKGLYRDDDRKPSAAVVVNLQPGRTLGDKELAGVRHLISAGVPGLLAEHVTIVDGRGSVLAADGGAGQQAGKQQRELERDLESRIVSLLEPAVGSGGVIAKVTATLDASEVSTQQEQYDSENPVLRSERKVTSAQAQPDGRSNGGGVAGAAANQPLQAAQAGQPGSSQGAHASSEDALKNYEIGKTVTQTVSKAPRLRRLSVAVLLDGVAGKPRTEAEVARLGELARRAVGIDATRGDVLEISSQTFARPGEEPALPAAATVPAIEKVRAYGPFAIGAVVALAVLIFAVRRGAGRGTREVEKSPIILRPGARVADIEATLAAAAGDLPPARAATPSLPDPNLMTRDRARELATQDPVRAAHLLKSWIRGDNEAEGRTNG